jgi:anti-sigma B factor antagonist
MLKARIEKLGRVAILRLRGSIVVGPELETFRKTVMSQLDVSAVLVDLARVSRIDAGGLGVLLQLREHFESSGVEFRLIKVTKLVRQVLEITRLDTVFEISSEENPPSDELSLKAAGEVAVG